MTYGYRCEDESLPQQFIDLPSNEDSREFDEILLRDAEHSRLLLELLPEIFRIEPNRLSTNDLPHQQESNLALTTLFHPYSFQTGNRNTLPERVTELISVNLYYTPI